MKHGLSCQKPHGTSTEFMQLIKGTYFGVIDVIDMRLMELPVIRGTPSRYVALSYVWGENEGLDKPHYKTTRANVMKHIQSQGLKKAWNLLPKTIRDVILLVNRLGERYLWIDSLCIVQDSASSWELNAKSMHLVYGNAYFTVCAADGDAETGLLAADVSTWMDSTTTTIDGTSSFTPSTKARTSSLSAEVAPGVRIIASRPAEAVIQGSRWSQRGWTFQERMLSRRCLIFIEGQVYFQCRSSLISQHIFPDHGGSSNDKNWSLEWTNSPLRTLEGLKRKAFWFYMKCVSLYTGRHLTKPQDVLAAFSGISWLLKQQMQAALFYGLPMSHFDLALLWTPIEPLERRRHMADFPSWSWAGWDGGKAEYAADMLDGALSNVQEWLRHHTWILWYLRDFEGNLRPLWDRDILNEDQSGERRWGGYAGRNMQPNQVRIAEHDSDMPHTPYIEEEDYRIYEVESEKSTVLGDDNCHYRREDEPYVPAYQPQRPSDFKDVYGRPIRDAIKGRNNTDFTGILPDNPFGIISAPFPRDKQDHAGSMPILQFWTWWAKLTITMRPGDHEDEQPLDNTSPDALVMCDLSDEAGDWCGAIRISRAWLRANGGGGMDAPSAVPLIALSDAKTFTAEECRLWNYYIPKERAESEWDLYYVMLLQRNTERALWERVAVGKVFQAAFGEAEWQEIKLG
ncbi:heterokaryon incompatibility protein-domain-containing protein [Plectosphaerella plurivora]|uniref:Heterokaryon incompatibility protein-domain-containing protein n=1 Tax=Plectosphaerella plurivora TaxID=936078 RepID=A0A9P8VGD3_9PEZI|nr:heterokaryon incompatibility protein-domain-containing protein [Plectosphaerella plurivora]